MLFNGQVRSACGFASSATGPFYCPGDDKLYIDLSFYSDLKNRFGAPGDFAMAYVVAHEVAHHVQNLLGISDQMHAQRRRISKTEYNKLSVRLELQADFFAGLWAHHAQRMKNILERGDIQEALNAAKAFKNRIEIIDLRTLYPLDTDTVFASVQKNSRCLVLTEEATSPSFAQSLAGLISEKCFKYLDAPVMTMGAENMPAIPLNSTLEKAMLPSAEKVEGKIRELLAF